MTYAPTGDITLQPDLIHASPSPRGRDAHAARSGKVRSHWICAAWLAALALTALRASAQAVDGAGPPGQVHISGSKSDTAARRDFIAGKILIGRKRIEESGVDNVGGLLRREPAVSVSSDGRIGLPGYTQILVDGAAPPPGTDVNQMNLVHVEKIEIVKSAVAEFGPFGIAGTINIVTRQSARKTSTRLGTGLRSMDGHPGANATLSHSQSQAGSPLRYSAEVSASRERKPGSSRPGLAVTAPGGLIESVWDGRSSGRTGDRMTNASGELVWDADIGHVLRFSPNGGQMTMQADSVEERRFATGESTSAHIASRSVLTMLNAPFNWTFKPDRTSQLEVRARLSRIRMGLFELRRDAGGPQPRLGERRQQADSRIGQLELNYKARVAQRHDIKVGLSVLRVGEHIAYDNRIDGAADAALDFLGTRRQSEKRHLRVYAQDDWRYSDSLALNAGLSGQHTAINLDEGDFSSAPRYRLWSPSFHATRKLGEDDQRQLRLSLARTFRAPDQDDLSLRPRIHPLAPCAASGVCGPNTIDTLDTAGNPQLHPERSNGINLSYEHGMGDDSTLTLEVYARRISNKNGTEITLAQVPWSAMPRYVSRPANLGEARVRGVNLELELALRDLWAGAPKLNVRGNVNLASSRIASLPGPDNRLDKQTPWSAKLGGSYAMHGAPLRFDLDASWSPGVWVRTNRSQRIAVPRRVEVDASASWTFGADRRLVASISSLVPRTARQVHEYQTRAGQVRLTTESERYPTFSLRVETAL